MTTTVKTKSTRKEVSRVHKTLHKHWVGNGFPVYSIFDYNGLGRELSPFLMLDYAEPYDFSPSNERRGVGAHPHKGFETVTIAYQGEIEHRDSSGGGGKIGPGDVQWMTAGKGIVHDEFHSPEFTRKGGNFQMIQLWVNLPRIHKNSKPGYQTLLKKNIPVVALPDEAGQIRVIAGSYADHKGPARTYTPIDLWDIQLRSDKTVEFKVPDGNTTAVLLLKGKAEFNNETHANERDLVILNKEGEVFQVHADTDSHLVVMGGQPIAEPIVGAGPFVMNSREDIEKAFRDYQNGLMGKLN